MEKINEKFLTGQILNSFRDVVFFALDKGYKYLYFNEAHAKEMKKIWGAEIKVGTNMLSYIKRDDDRKKARENFDRVLKGESFVVEEEYGDDALNRLYYEIEYSPLKDEKNEIIGLTVLLKNVTERKLRELEIIGLNKKLETIAIKRTEELFEHTEKFQLVLDTLEQGIVIHSKNVILYGNSSLVKMLKARSIRKLIGKEVTDFVHINSKLLVEERLRLLNTNRTESLPLTAVKIVRFDGTPFWAKVSSRKINFEGKDAIITTITDLTKEIEAGKKLEETNRIYIEAIKNINGVPYRFNYDSQKYDFIAEEVEKLFGVKRSDFTRTVLQSLIKEIVVLDFEDIDDPHRLTQMMVEGKVDKFNADYKVVTPQGKVKWISDKSVAIRDEKGNLVGSLGIMHDITERKFKEAELKEKEEILSAVIKDSINGIVIFSPDSTILEWNKAMERFTGYKREEVINEEVGKIISKLGANPGEACKQISELGKNINNLVGGTDNQKEKPLCRIINKFGEEVHLLSAYYVIEGVGEKLIVVIVRNVTDEINTEKRLREAAEQAEKANRLKSEFLAQISHEIRTPLNIILSYSQLIREQLADKVDKVLKDGFDAIQRAGNRLIRTIDLILSVSELHTDSYEYSEKEIDILEDILLPLKTEFLPLAEKKNLKLEILQETDNRMLRGDEYSIIKIFSNLIDNAVKYTEKGKVEVIVFRDEENRLAVSVKDTGIGIREDYLPYIFEPFSQEEQGYSRRFEGNGLGLTLVKEYCKINDAEIKVESKRGKGSTFTVVFNK